jgi:DNA-binding HxlR family transcriptional regulator
MTTSSRPIMRLLDLLGRRWTLRILWELRSGDPVPYAALREASDRMSTSVLATRLRELLAAGLVEQDASGAYRLTRDGVRLVEHLGPLDDFAKRWAGG